MYWHSKLEHGKAKHQGFVSGFAQIATSSTCLASVKISIAICQSWIMAHSVDRPYHRQRHGSFSDELSLRASHLGCRQCLLVNLEIMD